MNQNKKSIVLLFFILCYSLSVVAQIQKTKGKLTRIDGKTYISKNDKLCEIPGNDHVSILLKCNDYTHFHHRFAMEQIW